MAVCCDNPRMAGSRDVWPRQSIESVLESILLQFGGAIGLYRQETCRWRRANRVSESPPYMRPINTASSDVSLADDSELFQPRSELLGTFLTCCSKLEVSLLLPGIGDSHERISFLNYTSNKRMVETLTSALMLPAPLPLTSHPAAVYLASLRAGSRPTMQQALNAIASLLTNGECDALTLDWSRLTYRETAAVQAVLLERYSPATVQKMMCAMRRVLREARKLKLMDAQQYAEAADLPKIRQNSRLRGRALSTAEIAALMGVCRDDPTAQGIRDAALIAILRGAGLRRAEVVKLKLADLDWETGALQVRQGKGGKDRLVYLPQEAIAFVEDWLALRGQEPGALLCPIHKGGRVEMRGMTPQAVLLILQKRAKEAGVESFSPHDFRRTFCSDLLDAGVDIVTVQKLAGHASPTTTAKYDRRGEETKRKAVQCLGFS